MACKIKQDLSIGDNLKRLRQKEGLTQKEAAAKLQLRVPTKAHLVVAEPL